MTEPAAVLAEAVRFSNADAEFERLSSDCKLLLLAALQSFAEELLLHDQMAAEHAARLIEAVTGSSRLGAAIARAVRVWAGAVAGLAAEDQILLDHFLSLPLPQRLRRLRLLVQWDQAPPNLQAAALKVLNKRLRPDDMARLLEKSTRQVRRYPAYKTTRLLQRQQGLPRPRGVKDRDGQIEAWDDRTCRPLRQPEPGPRVRFRHRGSCCRRTQTNSGNELLSAMTDRGKAERIDPAARLRAERRRPQVGIGLTILPSRQGRWERRSSCLPSLTHSRESGRGHGLGRRPRRSRGWAVLAQRIFHHPPAGIRAGGGH